MDEASLFDWWYSVEPYTVQQIVVVPPREGERSGAEVVGREGAMAVSSGTAAEMLSLFISSTYVAAGYVLLSCRWTDTVVISLSCLEHLQLIFASYFTNWPEASYFTSYFFSEWFVVN
jgi:hypothetical protein